MAKNGLNYNKMKLLKYIFLLLPFCSLAQTPTGTSRAGYLVLNEAQTFSPSVRLHVNGTAKINGAVTLPYYTNGVLTVNGSGLVGVTAGIVPPAVGASGTVLTSNGTVSSWNLLTNSNVSNTANITATKLGTGVISNSEFNTLDGVITAKSIQSQFYERIRKDSLTISLNSGTGYLSLVGISGGSLVNLNLWGDPKYLKLTGGTLTGTLNGTGINSSGTNYIRGSNRFYGGMWFRDSTNANTYTNYKISTKTQSGNIKTLAIDYDYQFNGSGLSANDIFVIKGNSVGIRTADPTVAGLQVTGDVQYSGVLYTPLTTGHATINGAGILGSSTTIPSTDITGNFALNRITTANIGRVPYSNGTTLTESASLNFGTGTYGNTLFTSNTQVDNNSIVNGVLAIGGESNLSPLVGDSQPHILDIINNNKNVNLVRIFSAGNTGGQGNVHFVRTRGTYESPTATQNNDFFMSIGARGHNGTEMTGSQAAIQLQATENWTSSAMGTRFVVQTTPNGTTGRTSSMIFDGSGNFTVNGRLGVGIQAPSFKAHIQLADSTTYSPSANAGDGAFLMNITGASNNNKFTTLRFQTSSAGGNAIGSINLVQPSGNNNSAFAFQLRSTGGGYIEPMRIDGMGNVSIGKNGVAGTQKLEVVGNVLANRYINGGSTPSIVAGAGAGTAPTIAIVGRDNDFKITLTTGTTPVGTNAVVATVTYAGGAYPNGSIPTCTAGIAGGVSNAALLSGASMIATDGTTTTMVLYSGTAALTPATQYVFNCHSGGY